MQFRRLGIPSLKHIQPPRRALLSLAQGITNELLVFRVLTMKCQREEDTGFPVAQQWKNPPAMQETQETRDLSLGREDEGEMTTHSSILAWRIPGTEEPSRLQSMGLQGVGHNWATEPVRTREKGIQRLGCGNEGILVSGIEFVLQIPGFWKWCWESRRKMSELNSVWPLGFQTMQRKFACEWLN